jgi:hypothetical protein
MARKIGLVLLIGVLPRIAPAVLADDWNTLNPNYKHASKAAYERWRDLKFGLRIHWGYYSLLGVEASWAVRNMSNEEKQRYFELYKKFNPAKFDANERMNLMKRCGLTYFVFTTKHHDGFSMFDTRTRVKRRVNYVADGGPKIEECDLAYSIMDTPCKRDIVKELTDAAHKQRIGVGLYFSHIDWYDADFRMDKWNPFRDEADSRAFDQLRESGYAGTRYVSSRILLAGHKGNSDDGPPAAARCSDAKTRHRRIWRLYDAGKVGAVIARRERQAGGPALDGY